MPKTGNTKVYEYIRNIMPFLKELVEKGRISEPTKEAFFSEYLGYSKTHWLKLYNKASIRKVFYVILELMQECRKLKEDVKRLERQLNEITKK